MLKQEHVCEKVTKMQVQVTRFKPTSSSHELQLSYPHILEEDGRDFLVLYNNKEQSRSGF